jgi:nucleoid-associated protein YgaU
MPISPRQLTSAILLTLFFSVSGCASSVPPVEHSLALEAILNAGRAGAERMAVAEYREAQLTLKKGELLLKDGDQEAARETLTAAIVHAHQAETTTYIRNLNLAENRIQQLETQKEALLQAWRAAIADQEATIDFSTDAESQPKNKTAYYTIVEGESLFTIAGKKKVYGDALLWPLIYKANRDQIKDPQQIYPGQRLTIPRDVSELEMEEARNTARESTIFQP